MWNSYYTVYDAPERTSWSQARAHCARRPVDGKRQHPPARAHASYDLASVPWICGPERIKDTADSATADTALLAKFEQALRTCATRCEKR